MDDGGYCAEQQEIDEYFSTNHGLLFLSINLQQYNYETLEFEQIKKTEQFAFEEVSPFHAQVVIQKQQTTIDNGILFSNLEQYEVIKDFRVNTQTISSKFAEKTVISADGSKLQFDSLCSFGFRIDNKLGLEVILMPKLGEVLAQIGSIVNVIMLLKIFSNIINTTILESTLLDEIIEIYYPQFKQVQITRNVLGKVKQVHYKGVQIKMKTFKPKYNQLLDIARIKFTYNNLIQELSRIQMILIHQIGMENIKNIFKNGEDLQFLESDRLSNSPKEQEFEKFALFDQEFPFSQ
ncbi:unnamed protein product [Paramecium octaurelia]|uniref:Uncharacterized protein n=1 Tax=Paramecium octaurelia TaxID=43137 RepID=A0A8S1SPR5_PAROT|nr:unnamed protein product [Paramecium octaurelia]